MEDLQSQISERLLAETPFPDASKDFWFSDQGRIVFKSFANGNFGEDEFTNYASVLIHPCQAFPHCAFGERSPVEFPGSGESMEMDCGCKAVGIGFPKDMPVEGRNKKLTSIIQFAYKMMCADASSMRS